MSTHAKNPFVSRSNSMKIKFLSFLFPAVLAAASFAVSAAPGAATVDGSASVKVTGTVKSVNVATRTVTIVDAQGATASLEVGQDVPNLDKLASGTRVFGTTTRRVHLTVLADGEQAPNVAQVVSSDEKSGVVTLLDAQGESMTVQASDAAKAAALKAGARVAVEVIVPSAAQS
jgi:hypothetical protein